MIFIDKMKNFKIYRTKTFLPFLDGDKKNGSAVLLLTPNYESSRKLMNSDLFINNKRYMSYYLEKDVSYYINAKHIEEVDEAAIINERLEIDEILEETKRSELPDSAFGVPDKRKFPLDTEAHVRSAIKFFNYVDPEDEEELARRIITAMKKYNIYGKIRVSDKNRFSKYYHPKEVTNEATFEGIPLYHTIIDKIDLFYSMWKNGTMNESTARRKILEVMKSNMCISSDATELDVPGFNEYYNNRGQFGIKESMIVPRPEITIQEALRELEESEYINLGDKIIMLNESNKLNDTQLRKLLYKDRIRMRKDLLLLLDKVKDDNSWIKYAFPSVNRFNGKNLFVDLYFYNALFFENNTWALKKGINLYTDFMTRLISHPNIKSYKKKTIFIPILDWNTKRDSNVWNFRTSINPISCIYWMMFNNMSSQLKKTFGSIDIIFVGATNYFKVNFSQIDNKDMKRYATTLRLFTTKICNNDPFDETDIDTSVETKDSKEVLQAKLVDKIEKAKGIDLTKQVSDANKKLEDLNKPASDKEKQKEVNSVIDTIQKSMVGKTAGYVNNLGTSKSAAVNNVMSKNPARLSKASLDDIEDTSSGNEESEDDARKAAEIEKLADAIAQASNEENNDTEEDVLDDLDTDEIKRILADLGNDDNVDISPARASRMSSLDQKLLDKEINGRSIRDILEEKPEEEKEEAVNVSVDSPNKEEWDNLTYINFDKNYNIDKDIINIFRSFKDCTRPIVVRDIKVTDTSTSEDRISTYEVAMEDYRGVRYNIKLDIPIMEDNRFLLRGNYKSIQTQFFNMPIIKTDLGTCQLISNYKKIFLYRFNDSRGRSLPAVAKLVKAANKYTGNKIKFITGNNTKVCAKYQLPIDYIDLAGTFSRIETKDWIVYFNQDEIRNLYDIEEGKGFPFAYNKKLKAVEYYPPEIVDPFINMLVLNILEICPEFSDLYATMTRPTACAYSRASIMNSKIPLIIVCAYHIGLRATMDRAGIKYTLEEKLTKEIRADINKDWIKFEDGYVVYDVNYESSMLMNGLKGCSTDLYKLEDIDTKNMYVEFLDDYGGRIKAYGLDNFYDLFVDPMIKESLEYYHLSTNYIDILLYGNAMLNDNKFIKHTNTASRRMRRYQLIAVYTYLVLSQAYGSYANQLKHSRRSAEFNVKQSAVIDAFLTDTITSDDSCINALRDVETTNSVTTKGPSGMNADRAYSLDKRGYDGSMLNVLGMSTGFAGNVGITRQTTINANITADGYVKQGDTDPDNMNDANTLTTTEAIIPMASTHDDPMRTAMSFIQTSKHSVRTEDSDPLLVTSGADEVMPYMTTNKFAYKAAKRGKVLEVTDEYILVEYEDGKKEYINLGETIEKNSDGGYYVPLKLDKADNIKPGMKFDKDTILAYDKLSFSNSLGESDNLAYNVGKLAKVAILNTDEGFEDSGIISSSLAKKLATRVILKYDVVLDKDTTLVSIAKVGDHIEASDNLLVYQDAFDDEDANEIMASLNDGDLSELGKRKLKSEVTGELKGIKVYRTVELNDLSPSLKKFVSAYEKPLKERANYLKEQGINPATKVAAHYVLPATGKLKKAQDAILIEFYVEYLDTVGIGDKVVYNAANKAVEKSVMPEGLEPYTAYRPNEKIDAMVADQSISKRLVSSSYVYGSLQKLMVELDRHVKDIMGIKYDDSTI